MSVRKRVLVTRAAQQGSALAEQLRVLGLEPILIPAIEIAPPFSFEPLDAALAQRSDFHWLIFTSANAVEVFGARLGSQAGIVASKIAAIGSATARAVEALGLRADLVPAQAVAESLTAALLPYVRQPDGSTTRYLLIRAEEARDHLPETLRAAGAEVTIAPAYRTVLAEGSVDQLRRLFLEPEGGLDAVTFTSSSTVRHLLALCDAAGVSLPKRALRVSIGPITSQTLRDFGLEPDAEAPEATLSALAETVSHALTRKAD